MGFNKINLLITTYNLDSGGVEEVILTYTKLLDKSKYNITVACLVSGIVSNEIASIDGVNVIHIDTKSRIKRFFEFWKVARDTKANIVHNHACWYGLIVGFLVGAKRVETVHNIYQWFIKRERIQYGLYCLLVNKIITVSEYVKTYTLENFPLMKQKKFIVIHNGIDLNKFQKDYNQSELRKRFSITSDEIVVGFVGRLTEQKGVEYLIEAAHRISPIAKNIKFIIVGDGELKDKLEKQVRKYALTNTMFVGFQRDVSRYLNLFDIFVLPSLWEGLPVSVLEAFASEKPVVATKVSGTPEVVRDGINGYLVEPKNIEQLTEKILLLANNPTLMKEFGKKGKELILSEFTANAMVSKTEKVYSEILGVV